MFCSNCGAKIDEHVKFCPKCGAAQHADASGAGTGGQQGSAFQDAGSSRPGTWQVEGQPAQEPKISIRTASMLCYWFSFIGWLICYYFSDNRNPYLKFHLNQALVLWLCGLLGMLPHVGSIISIVVFVLWIIAFVGACKGETKPVPLLGNLQLLK